MFPSSPNFRADRGYAPNPLVDPLCQLANIINIYICMYVYI